ncbi:type VI secretion system tube protein TssD [Pseudomonas sp.]|uniref:type VI secretion system tube protein TssD n=1 Tax=Pseudomonas sp. TaxID=306 RepID=UPI00262877C1|nr:type VI secretion system tube protein TssD [Pseudomonas sp.]
MSNDTFISITGRNQGLISKGCSTRASTGNESIPNHLDEIRVLTLDHEMLISNDVTQSKHEPVVFTKHMDRSSPLILNAIASGEMVDCEITYYEETPSGAEEKLYRITLVDAVITTQDIRHRTIPGNDSGTQERLTIQYRQITCVHHLEHGAESVTYVNTDVGASEG